MDVLLNLYFTNASTSNLSYLLRKLFNVACLVNVVLNFKAKQPLTFEYIQTLTLFNFQTILYVCSDVRGLFCVYSIHSAYNCCFYFIPCFPCVEAQNFKNYCHTFYSIFGKINFDREILLKAIHCPYNLVGKVQVKLV